MSRNQTIDLKYIPTPRQAQAHGSSARYLLYGGAVGGGKSKFLCMEAIQLLIEYSGNRGFLGRLSFEDLKRSTLLEFENSCPPELIANWQKVDKKITLKNGSVLYYGDCANPDKLKSMELGFIMIDEASEVSKDFFSVATTRLRHKLPNGNRPHYRILLTSNPEPCWLIDQFVQGKHPDCEFVPALPKDNPYLPEDYEKRLYDILPREMAEKYIEGKWDDLGSIDCVFNLNKLKLCQNMMIQHSHVKRIVACDPARFGDDESVIYGMENGKILAEKILYKQDLVAVAMECKAMKEKIEAYGYAIDGDGLGGGVIDHLSYLHETNIYEFHGNATPRDSIKYYNEKAEAWFNAAKMVEDRLIEIPVDDKLIAELSTMKYRYQSGRLILEKKEDYKKRIGKSPNRADAYIYGLWGLQFCEDYNIMKDKYSRKRNTDIGYQFNPATC